MSSPVRFDIQTEKSSHTEWCKSFFGADSQIRTGDLILTKDALYLLSYISKLYAPLEKGHIWRPRRDLNPRPASLWGHFNALKNQQKLSVIYPVSFLTKFPKTTQSASLLLLKIYPSRCKRNNPLTLFLQLKTPSHILEHLPTSHKLHPTTSINYSTSKKQK